MRAETIEDSAVPFQRLMVTPVVSVEPVHTLCLTRGWVIWYRVLPEPKFPSASAVSHAWMSAIFQPIELLKLARLSPCTPKLTRLPVVFMPLGP